jgi:hypothetical protein
MSLRENKDIALMLLAMFVVVGGVLFLAYMDSQKPTINLRKEDWSCTRSEPRTRTQMVLVGKVLIPQRTTSDVCAQYNRLGD